jgi:hypothetical protein
MRLLFTVLFLATSAHAFASTLYAVDDTGGVSHLWTIDTTTGAATQGVTLSMELAEGDISWLNGTLYAGDNIIRFGTIDPATGSMTVINGGLPVDSLAADPNRSVFYDIGSTEARVDVIAPDGSSTHFPGNSGDEAVADLAYDPVHDVLYASTIFGTLVSIDTSTFDGTIIGTVFALRDTGPVAYDWSNGTLYILRQDPADKVDKLYSLDVTNGTPTLIGSTGVSNVRFDAFADLPVPEPSTVLMVGLGLAGLAWVRSRSN